MERFSAAKYIQMIAEMKNISAAADQLKISQPALSSQLKKLENSLGTVLFDRTKQPLEITEAGRVYLDYATRYQALEREFMQQISDIEELKAGKITIGGAASFNVSYLPKTVAEFMNTYSGVDIEIVDGSVPEIMNKALNGQIDIFIAPTIELDDRFKYEELLYEKIFLCVPPKWEINRRITASEVKLSDVMSGEYAKDGIVRTVDFCEFKDCPFILLKKDQHIGKTMSMLFEKYGFEPEKYVTAEQTMTSYGLTVAGVGISLMTESTIKNSNFKVYPKLYMPDVNICNRKIYAVYSRQKYLSKAARIFMTMLKKNLSLTYRCGK